MWMAKDSVWFHVLEVPRVVRFIEIENSMVVGCQGLGEGKVESCFLMGSFHFKIQRVLEIGCANSVNARNATKLYLNSKRTNG